jgi:hypothetical protein
MLRVNTRRSPLVHQLCRPVIDSSHHTTIYEATPGSHLPGRDDGGPYFLEFVIGRLKHLDAYLRHSFHFLLWNTPSFLGHVLEHTVSVNCAFQGRLSKDNVENGRLICRTYVCLFDLQE